MSFSSSYEQGLHLRLGMFFISCLGHVSFQTNVKVAKLQQFHIVPVRQFKNMQDLQKHSSFQRPESPNVSKDPSVVSIRVNTTLLFPLRSEARPVL